MEVLYGVQRYPVEGLTPDRAKQSQGYVPHCCTTQSRGRLQGEVKYKRIKWIRTEKALLIRPRQINCYKHSLR